MSVRASGRVAIVIGPLVAAGFVLGACGGDTDAVTKPSIVLDQSAQTNYQTIPPPTTPITVAAVDTSVPEAGGAPASEYKIQSGDFPLGVAGDFGVELAELAQINGWTSCTVTLCAEFPGPGSTIKIPAGGTSPTASGGGSDDETTDTVDPNATGSTIPASGDNCDEGTYTVAAGDVPFAVAEKFDVTFDRLQAANPGIDFKTSFPVGSKIVIPAAEDC